MFSFSEALYTTKDLPEESYKIFAFTTSKKTLFFFFFCSNRVTLVWIHLNIITNHICSFTHYDYMLIKLFKVIMIMNDFVLRLPKAPVTLSESKGNMRSKPYWHNNRKDSKWPLDKHFPCKWMVNPMAFQYLNLTLRHAYLASQSDQGTCTCNPAFYAFQGND